MGWTWTALQSSYPESDVLSHVCQKNMDKFQNVKYRLVGMWTFKAEILTGAECGLSWAWDM